MAPRRSSRTPERHTYGMRTGTQAVALADTLRARGWIVWHVVMNVFGLWEIDAQRTPSRPLEVILSPEHWAAVQTRPAPRLRLGDRDWTRWEAEIPPSLEVILPPAGQLLLFADEQGNWAPGLWPDWLAEIMGTPE